MRSGALRFISGPAPVTVFVMRHDPAVASRHVTRCTPLVIKTFADRRTQELYATGKGKRIPADVAKRAARKLEYLDLATSLDDLKVPPGNRLHALTGDRKDQH
jgi:antitoxin HigA-1